jgi:glycerophosphoryl diester phosphodiesterase
MVLISAHRGSCGVAGLPAAERYDRAIRLGVDFVELDVRRTSDARYVNYHDHVTPSGRPIARATFSDLKAELGAELLELGEILDVVAGRAGLHVDLKQTGYESEVLRAVIGRCNTDRFVVTTGEVDSIRLIKDQFPQVRAGLTLGTDMKNAHAWTTLQERMGELFPGPRLRRSHADFVAAHEQLARVRLLDYCARRAMGCWVWTVDDAKEIARFMADSRVTTLVTNRPDIAVGLRL